MYATPPVIPPRGQFSLRAAFWIMTFACAGLAVAIRIDPDRVPEEIQQRLTGIVTAGPVVLSLLAVAAVMFGFAVRRAPEAAKVFALCGCLLFMACTLLPCALLQSREATRRQQALRVMRCYYETARYADEFRVGRELLMAERLQHEP